MLLRELYNHLDEKQIWGRSGQKVVRKFRCTVGRRKGRIVKKIAQCFASPNIKARITMKRTRARVGAKMMRKRQKTMRTNPASKRVQALNKAGSKPAARKVGKSYRQYKPGRTMPKRPKGYKGGRK
jgi:hypothetical protein